MKVSLRGKGRVNVAAIAEEFGGGGHHDAAGCSVEGTLDDAPAWAVASSTGISEPR